MFVNLCWQNFYCACSLLVAMGLFDSDPEAGDTKANHVCKVKPFLSK